MLNIQRTRVDTPTCEHYVHLNNAGASLPPTSVVQAQLDYLEFEAKTGGYEAAEFKSTAIQTFYSRTAQLLNVHESQVAFMTSATAAYNTALSSIPLEEGDVILTTNDDYASNQIAFLVLQKRKGIRVIRAEEAANGGVDVDSVEDLMKKFKPRLVAITHVPTSSGLVQDVNSIGTLCSANDVWYMVDGCQAAGQLDIDVEAIGCDFYTASFRKFLRGPRGTGFLCISERVIDEQLVPLFPDLCGAEWIAPNDYKLLKNARCFEYWERNYANLMGASAALAYALDIGLPNIETRVKKLANYTREKLNEISGFEVMDRGEELCGIISLKVPKDSAKEIKQHLSKHRIHVSTVERSSALIDFTKKGINSALRISPHYYNTRKEIDEVYEILSNY